MQVAVKKPTSTEALAEMYDIPALTRRLSKAKTSLFALVNFVASYAFS